MLVQNLFLGHAMGCSQPRTSLTAIRIPRTQGLSSRFCLLEKVKLVTVPILEARHAT